MPHLVLIRHAHSAQNRNTKANAWGLSERGIAQCEPLANRVGAYAPTVILTSEEPKAALTGQLVAQRLGIACHLAPNLHEHRRETTPWFESVTDFEAAVKRMFHQPNRLVFGEETAREALARFSNAIDSVIDTYPNQSVGVVTHGTVMALYVAQRTGEDAFAVWKALQMPDVIAFNSLSF